MEIMEIYVYLFETVIVLSRIVKQKKERKQQVVITKITLQMMLCRIEHDEVDEKFCWKKEKLAPIVKLCALFFELFSLFSRNGVLA
jgi:hypothetical protein